MRRLEARDRTVAELADVLRSRATPEPVVTSVLDRLAELGLVDDRRVARTWVEASRRTRGLTGRALTAGLVRRGVADDVVAAVVAEGDDGSDELAAVELARSRVARMPGTAPQIVARRVAGQLARRGYRPAVAYRAVRTVLNESVGAPDGLPDQVERD